MKRVRFWINGVDWELFKVMPEVKAIEVVSFKQDVKLLLGGKFEPGRLKDEVEALPRLGAC